MGHFNPSPKTSHPRTGSGLLSHRPSSVVAFVLSQHGTERNLNRGAVKPIALLRLRRLQNSSVHP